MTSTATAADPDALQPRSRRTAVDGLVLAVLPVAVFVLMRVQPMARVMSVDPTFYTGYIDQGPDLIARYGTDRYFWARVGMVVPGRITNLVFGPVAGFYMLRYVFAILVSGAAYLLFRRLWGRSAGLIAALVMLVNPVVLRAWTSDYPDGATITYLLAGICFLLMPARRRLPWVTAAAACLTLAVHSNVFAASLVLATLAGYSAMVIWGTALGTAVRQLLWEGAVVVGVFLGLSLTLAVLAEVLVGAGNILHPTVLAMREVRDGLLDDYHSQTLRWLLRETQLWVVPLNLALWVVLSRRPTVRPTRHERSIVLISALHYAFFAAWQFFNRGQTLENYLYASWLWASGSLLAAVVLNRIWMAIPRSRTVAVAAVAIVGVPLIFRSLAADLQFLALPWVPLILIVSIGIVSLAARLRSPSWLGPVAQTVVVVTATYVLTTGKPQGLPLLPGSALQPQASYGDVFLNADDRYLEIYRIATALPEALSETDDEPGRLLTWWSHDAPDLVEYASAMYLWRINSVMGFDFESPGLPELTSWERSALSADPPRFIVLLGSDDTEFPAAVETLAAAGLAPHPSPTRTLRSGGLELSVALVELESAK